MSYLRYLLQVHAYYDQQYLARLRGRPLPILPHPFFLPPDLPW